MAFIPHSDANYNVPASVSSRSFWDIPASVSTEKGNIWSTESYLFGNGVFNSTSSLESDQSLSDFRTSFPDRFGVTEVDLADIVLTPDGGHDCVPSQGWGMTDVHSTDSGLIPDFQCNCGATGDEWEIHGNSVAKDGQPGVKIPRYSVEERKDRILRYLKKRNQRNFNKTIKYACRKTLADRRRRVRGRFASNNEIHEGVEHYHDDISKIGGNVEDWCEEAMCVPLYNWLNNIQF